MKRIKTIETRDLKKSVKTGGCGECQTSCQSACKTSCTVGNQSCENKKKYYVDIYELLDKYNKDNRIHDYR